MNRWYFVFWYRDASGKTGYKSGVTSTIVDFFAVKQISQEVADSNNFEEICMTNWRQMTELEFMAYSGKDYINLEG